MTVAFVLPLKLLWLLKSMTVAFAVVTDIYL